ncbi:hypothetical protein LAT59_01000 [Candidatus Gracilibacteria bacterium]|nr:hypothetical protein [Candidatus Gracilibacteria bacterium]
MKKIFFIFIFLILLFPYAGYSQVSEEHKEIFQKFSQIIEKRYSTSDQEIIYQRLATMIDPLLLKIDTSEVQRKRLSDIQSLSRERLFEIHLDADASIRTQLIKELRIKNSSENISNLRAYSQLQQEFQYFITEDRQFVGDGDIWTGVYFRNFVFFPNEYGVSERDLERNNISKSSTPLYRDTSGRYNFIPDHEKKIFLTEDVFFGLPEKFHLMQNLYDDMKYSSTQVEQTLREIQKITLDITAGKNREQKIEAIYHYILENLSYSENFQLDDMYIYSGLEAFKRGSAVCTGYVKLMSYMLAFAGIDDFEVIRGYVIDADDFPRIGHAWIRIGNKYYDPTFDDPIGVEKTLTPDEYRYYGLPRDIMYTNRFDYGTLPEDLITASLQDRKKYIRNSLADIYDIYKHIASRYRIFDEIVFREKYNFGPIIPFSISTVTSRLTYIEVNGETFRYIDNGTQRQIQRFNFFILTDTNIDSLLEQIKYDLTDYTLMKWMHADGTHEWRFGFNMEVR